MKAVYIASILLFWLSFLFGKSQAQTVSTFSTQHTNGDIELSPSGHLFGISNHFSEAPDHESGFEQLDMDAEIIQFMTYPNKNFKHIGVSQDYIFLSEPDSNKIYVYSQLGQQLNCIEDVDNPGNIFTDENNYAYVVETDLKKISRFTGQGQKTVICADPILTNAVSITGDAEGNLFTADKYTGQIYRWEKASQTLYPFARIPSGSLCEDGSQISEMVFMNGKLYVASVGLCVIYVVDEVGTITELAGSAGMQGDQNDIGNKARFMHPDGLAASTSGDTLFVSDNGKIKMITNIATLGIEDGITKNNFTLFPNPSTNYVNIKMNDKVAGDLQWKLLDMEGRTIETGTTYPDGETISLQFNSNPCGNYNIIVLHRGNPLLTQQIILCNQ